jgi:hypothetical protein
MGKMVPAYLDIRLYERFGSLDRQTAYGPHQEGPPSSLSITTPTVHWGTAESFLSRPHSLKAAWLKTFHRSLENISAETKLRFRRV